MLTEEYPGAIIICLCVLIGFVTALYYSWQTWAIKFENVPESKSGIMIDERSPSNDKQHNSAEEVEKIVGKIAKGANAFLWKEYTYLSIFMTIFGVIILLVVGGSTSNWADGALSMISFFIGAITSIVSGFIGMRIATAANGRVAIRAAQAGVKEAFLVAFKAGSVMGFALVSLGVIVLYALVAIYRTYYLQGTYTIDESKRMFEAVAGFGLGGSSVALFGRVGGGIFTKAADVGADLVGKSEFGINEDDAANPAVIADNVGDNVGDIAGMGADLFGSFAEASCATMVIASQSNALHNNWNSLIFPIVLVATGIVVCLITTFFSTHLFLVETNEDIEPSLKRQLLVSTIIMTPIAYGVCVGFLPDTFDTNGLTVKNWYIFFCVIAGLWSGMIIGYITEYYTSFTYSPVQDLAESCKTGAATNIIFGLALGYLSVIIPVFCIAITIFIGFSLAGMFGIACAALGILSTLPCSLTIDAYGPISDNAGGIAEMAEMGADIRKITDALDAAGNTTAAIGKGFAIGSAAFVSLALFGAFVTTTKLPTVNILDSFVFAGLLVGAMLPYWFTAMTMKSVGIAAFDMVEEVRRQFNGPNGKAILAHEMDPDYESCVAIATAAAVREMIAPGCLVMLSPLLVGFLLGTKCLAGLLAGALVSGVQIAISSSNTGGAWDNAKKYIEGGNLWTNAKPLEEIGKDTNGKPQYKQIKAKKGSPEHFAAVTGDTVGDPLKDTSGPSLNILIKLMAIISVVFARSFPSDGYFVRLCLINSNK